MTSAASGLREFLDSVGRIARSAGVFAGVEIEGDRLVCHAEDSAEPAQYRVEPEGDALWVSLVMEDRWLSESIEAGLMHSGDKLEELLEEELVEQGYDQEPSPVQHFRSDDMLFTFRSRLPVAPGEAAGGKGAQVAGQWLLAYEACFRQLGDMDAGDGDD